MAALVTYFGDLMSFSCEGMAWKVVMMQWQQWNSSFFFIACGCSFKLHNSYGNLKNGKSMSQCPRLPLFQNGPLCQPVYLHSLLAHRQPRHIPNHHWACQYIESYSAYPDRSKGFRHLIEFVQWLFGSAGCMGNLKPFPNPFTSRKLHLRLFCLKRIPFLNSLYIHVNISNNTLPLIVHTWAHGLGEGEPRHNCD